MADAHAKPQHDYHLVNPSPWPFLGSVGALVMAIGGVCLMEYLKGGEFPIFGHNIANPWLFFIGLLIVLYTMLPGGRTRSRKRMRAITPASSRCTCATA